MKSKLGHVIPVEVKSGKRTQAKNLKSYKKKYSPEKTIKLIGSVGGNDGCDIVWPLYYAKYIFQL